MFCLICAWINDSINNRKDSDLKRHRTSNKTSKLRVTGLCEGNSPVTGEFPAQMAGTRKMFPFDDVILEIKKCVKSNVWKISPQTRQISPRKSSDDDLISEKLRSPHLHPCAYRFNAKSWYILHRKWPLTIIWYIHQNSANRMNASCWLLTLKIEKKPTNKQTNARSREVSKPWDSVLHFSIRSEIWQAPRQQHCRHACKISERYDHYNIQYRGFETSRGLAVRRLDAKWIEALNDPTRYETF